MDVRFAEVGVALGVRLRCRRRNWLCHGWSGSLLRSIGISGGGFLLWQSFGGLLPASADSQERDSGERNCENA
ncbi:hypothetical protein D3C83_223560 [compost metagenome]